MSERSQIDIVETMNKMIKSLFVTGLMFVGFVIVFNLLLFSVI